MKKLIVLVVAFMSLCVSNAQVRFTATISGISSGCNSSGDNLTNAIFVGVMEGLIESYNSRTFPDCKTCERARQSLTGSASHGGCTVRLATTPCTPCGGASGSVNILGPSQGYSFYSSNPADEVSDWSNNDIERQLALNSNYQTNHPEAIITNDDSYNRERTVARENSGWYLDVDKPFVSVNMREGGFSRIESEDYSMQKKFDQATDFSFLANSANVQRYVNASTSLAASYIANSQDLTQLLHNQFRIVSGFDLDAIMQKLPSERTDAEKQALIDYQEYRKKVLEQMIKDIECTIDNSKEKKEMDAAILALDSYGDDTEGWLSQTNYKKLDLASLSADRMSSNHSSMIKVAEEIKKCNDTQSETGFHADLYYNEVTNTYVVSFRGTEFDDENDIKTDKLIGENALNEKIQPLIGGNAEYKEIKQYEMAMQIAEVINKIPIEERNNLNIEVVGHSLGGGLASIVGLETGIDAKTYNASMVPDVFLKDKGLYDKAKNSDVQNISAYHTNTDLLTNTQSFLNASAIGVSIDIGNPATLTETANAIGTGMVEGFSKGGKVGVTGGMVGGVVGAAGGVMAEGHKMIPIVRSICNSNNEKKKIEWDRLHYLQSNIRNNANQPERQTQESILIITE